MTNSDSEQTGETHEKWEPIDGVSTPAASASVAEDQEGLIVTLLFSQIVDAGDSDLRIEFGRVEAYTVYEEFLHPWKPFEPGPTLAGRWSDCFYPLLQVKNSAWMASLTNLSVIYPDCIHYRLLTLDQIVDVLCSETPKVTWVRVSDEDH